MTDLNHPGLYVKNIIENKGLSVAKAAKLLGIGRPALSNFLNGKAELSLEMAARLEKVLDINKDKLLKIQFEINHNKISDHERELPLGRYIGSNSEIRVIDIEQWSERQESRAELAVLIRRLIHDTGIDLIKVNFSGYENSELPGWDGEVESNSATHKIPAGKSGWEFGTNKDPKKKANHDYQNRTKGISNNERQNLTFIFVTPRNWKDKKTWEQEKRDQKEWKDVKVYDADDIEQWIEQSPVTQVWFLEKIEKYNKDLWSLDKAWEKWSCCDPKDNLKNLNRKLFYEIAESNLNLFSAWLKSNPKNFILTANSIDEALAFLSCLFEKLDNSYFYDKSVIVNSDEALEKISVNAKQIIITTSKEAEKNLCKKQLSSVHKIIVRNKNELFGSQKADLELKSPSYSSFKSSLIDMGVSDDNIYRYLRECGFSPTILRRIISTNPSIKEPSWVRNKSICKNLIPLTLIGCWNKNKKDDEEVLHALFGLGQEINLKDIISEIRELDSSLIWEGNGNIGVRSKIENLFFVGKFITKSEIDNFLFIAEYVLSEKDPSLELPEENRWMAGIYNKIRNHSDYLREGICETLTLLSVHGNEWFEEGIKNEIKNGVDRVIGNLLKPFNENTWFSQKSDLPRYAEASPEVFLEILEEDLKEESPKILSLLKPEKNGMFGGCPRSGLLWALEILAWNPQRLERVVRLLSRLSLYEIDDNYSNKPINSLKNIFKSWMPQTSASIDSRIKILSDILVKEFPLIAWRICLSQVYIGQDTCSPSCRPRWRNDASGYGNGVNNKERYDFVRTCINVLTEWKNHDETTLKDLLDRLRILNNEDCKKIWNAVLKWNSKNSDDQKKAKLRENIRVGVFAKYAYEDLSDYNKKTARTTYDLLEPENLIWRYHWLFANSWVSESMFENNKNIDSFDKAAERIKQLRIEALSKIWKEKGVLGIKNLILSGNAGECIGLYLRDLVTNNDIFEITDNLLSENLEEVQKIKVEKFISGVLSPDKEEKWIKLVNFLLNKYSGSEKEKNKIAVIIKNTSLCKKVWDIISNLSEDLQEKYWLGINQRIFDPSEDDLEYLIKNLIKFKRPKYALSIIEFPQLMKKVSSDQLIDLLKEVSSSNSEFDKAYNIHSYTIEEAFKVLSERTDVAKDRLSGLEFLYIKTLEHTSYGVPNLENDIANSPQLFVQALAISFKRSDHKDDIEKWLGKNAKNNKNIASATYSILSKIKRIPGTKENDVIDKDVLLSWVEEVRLSCRENDRADIGDQYIGKLLSKSKIGLDGIWPCEAVRDVLEKYQSKHINIGFSIGVSNSRGVFSRGLDEGGKQERNLSSKYRNWSQKIKNSHPHVSAILESIANDYEKDAQFWDDKVEVDKFTNN